jgi:hypothetical protein
MASTTVAYSAAGQMCKAWHRIIARDLRKDNANDLNQNKANNVRTEIRE